VGRLPRPDSTTEGGGEEVTEERPPLLEGATAEPPLFARRFDPKRLRLAPPDTSKLENAHHVNRAAYARLASAETFEQRRELFPQTARRKRVGTRAKPVRRKQGRYKIDDLEVRKHSLKVDAAEGLIRYLSWVVLNSDWRTGKVGLWRDGEIKYQSRTSLADRAGFPARVDDKGRIRAYQLDDRQEDAIAAGFLFRHEEVRTQRVVLKIMPLLWIVLGVQKLREEYGQRMRKDAAKAQREREDRYETEKARRRAQAKDPAYAAQLVTLTRARTNDTDFTAPEARGWPTRDKPPDK
jgi:hypothetical protein